MTSTLQNRISWLDYGKGLSMLIIILFHTDIYYVGESSFLVDLLFYHTSIAFFFFASGYTAKLESFNFRNSILYIVSRLLIPYFIFSTLIYIPKFLLRGWEIDVLTMLYEIFGGLASWFIASLVVSRLALSIILKFTRNVSLIGAFCLLLSAAGFIMTQYLEAPILWYANYGLMSMLYICLGLIFRKQEALLGNKIKLQALVSTILYLLFVLIDLYVLKDSPLHNICSSSYIYGLKAGQVVILRVVYYLITSILGIWMIISLLKLMPSGINYLSYVGRNSLTYYYLNGGVVFILTFIFNKTGYAYTGNYLFVLFLYISNILVLTLASEIILRFAPWMVGISKKNTDK